jgi:outer membrane protein, multidrug efflux system
MRSSPSSTPQLGLFAVVAILTFGGVVSPALGQSPQPAPPSPPEQAPLPPIHAPPVSDPMLAPPPDAPRVIASWDDAVALIRAQSPDYRSSAENVARAKAQERIALAAVLPVLTAQGLYTHQFETAAITLTGPNNVAVPLISPAPNTWTAAAAASWNVVDPRALYGVATAQENTDVVRLSFEDRRRQIAVAVVGAMLETLAASRVAELNRAGLRAALERQVLTKTRLEYAQGTALDVDRADQDVQSARTSLINGDESLRRAREALGEALGSPAPVSAAPDLDLQHFEEEVSRTCRLNADVEARPDVRAARARVRLAERGVTAADLLLSPWLNVNSQFATSSASTLGPLTTWSVQGVITLPLYDGGARYGVRRDALAAEEQARQALTAARLNAIVESAQAGRAVGVLQASLDVAKQQRELAQRIDQRTRDGYARGLGTSLDLVISAQALRQAEINLALLEFQVGSARANAVLTNAECIY